jgi:hypothetical protein
MLAKVRDTIERHGMLSAKRPSWSVSPGRGSAVLLHVSKLTDEYC